jgi:GT2 family glycosyltransferase
MMKKKIAIVILNWNGRELLKTFLPSVVANSPLETADVIVADNGSDDDSINFIQENFPSVSILPLGHNYGFAEGYNRALERIDSEYCVLLNSDVEVTPGWLDAPLALLDADKDIACVQPKILSWTDKTRFEYAGAAGGFIDRYGYPFCRGRILHVVEEDRGQYDDRIDILWATGACLFIRTDIYKEKGGLDPRFFAHQEEVDLCWRLRSQGRRIVFVPDSVVFHVGGATLTKSNPRKTFLNFRNSLLMLYKNLPDADLRHVMRVRRALDYVAAAKFMFCGQWKDAIAVYKARRAFSIMKKEYEPVRRDNMEKTVSTVPELMRRSIIAAFYLHGCKTFSELRFRMGEG